MHETAPGAYRNAWLMAGIARGIASILREAGRVRLVALSSAVFAALLWTARAADFDKATVEYISITHGNQIWLIDKNDIHCAPDRTVAVCGWEFPPIRE
jgi:hypothetical protein